MARWILVVGYDAPHLELARVDWERYSVQLEAVNTVEEAITQFPRREYLAVIASFDVPDITPLSKYMGGENQIPLIVLPQDESGIKFMGSIIHNAHMVILDTDRLVESIEENKDYFK